MIVATAGHIDHGKTLLVKALTGVDSDRLPEERARGMSIDLGFAYAPRDDGAVLGFVDVPGHERFVRNMLAGVSLSNLPVLTRSTAVESSACAAFSSSSTVPSRLMSTPSLFSACATICSSWS